MSRAPLGGYGYTAPQYYCEVAENYPIEYSENEDIQENHLQVIQASPVIHEIFRRKTAALAPPAPQCVEARYQQNNYIPEYYYDQMSHTMRCSSHHHQATQPLYVPVYDTQPPSHQYYHQQPSISHDAVEINAYRSTPQVSKAPKRYPVTVRTPRYYRRPPPGSTLYKRPSALCLHVTCKPDPAVYRRHRQMRQNEVQNYTPQDVTYPQETTVVGQFSAQDLPDHKMDSEGDVNLAANNLDDLLTKFELAAENDLNENKISSSDVAQFTAYLKPRVPLSIKSRQEKLRKHIQRLNDNEGATEESSMQNDEIIPDPQEMGPESLDKLLKQLRKCENVESNESCKKESSDEQVQQNEEDEEPDDKDVSEAVSNENNEPVEDESKPAELSKKQSSTKSFNYKDISDQMLRSQSESGSTVNKNQTETRVVHQRQEITRRASSSATTQRLRPSGILKQPLDDHCAIELHRSKSYIVNLIDRALSKELGTAPCEKFMRKEFDHHNTKKAIDLVNRHTCGKIDKELCLEITTALADSIVSNATAPETNHPNCSAHSSRTCTCACADEPMYIKQLKQLRWGHLRHIQREVRRLEELERFLDSCTHNTPSEAKF